MRRLTCHRSSGNVANGVDLVAAYVKETYSPTLAELAVTGSGIAIRSQEYNWNGDERHCHASDTLVSVIVPEETFN